MISQRTLGGGFWILASVLVATACGPGGGSSRVHAGATNVSTSVSTTMVTTTEATTTTTPAPSPPTTPIQSAKPSVFAGRYTGATGSSGNAEIKDDGSGRFEVPDLIACPSCSNAAAPRATIDFRLSGAAPTGSGGYRGAGVITAESDPAQAAAIGAGAVGRSIEASLSAAGGLTLSFLRPENVLLRTGGAASAPTPATATRTDTGPDSFVSPTGNIGCRMSQTTIRCDVREHDWQPPPKPATCNLDWGSYLGVIGQEPGAFRCVGDTAIGGVTTVLAYGSVARRGPFECRSEATGMTCVHLDTGHGIAVSRGEYKLS